MKYMYTTQPDEGCREIEVGIYGRPVHTYHQSSLRKQGWVYSINDIEVTRVRQEKEGRQEEVEVTGDNVDYDEFLRHKYEELIGKKPHYKMKRETLEEKIAEAEANDHDPV